MEIRIVQLPLVRRRHLLARFQRSGELGRADIAARQGPARERKIGAHNSVLDFRRACNRARTAHRLIESRGERLQIWKKSVELEPRAVATELADVIR